jgi:hypothetical protein
MRSDSLQLGEAYFSIQQDLRRCASPLCGGFYVSQLNASTTECADGLKQSMCYVAELISDNPQIAEHARQSFTAIVAGRILPKTFEGFGNLGQINVSKLWLPFTP